ncbi:MAG TPA: LacI family DNA-binding transcriptional regulator [Mycobacteriales bacterium]|nr:LacI family DNA-binding transcriptional regulator [Mycobacteriales bacterium]
MVVSTDTGRRHSPTIRDVAAAADVSRGTVSRVLNGGRYVSPGALAAVEKAIREMGYVANHSARSLARRRTDCVAFILSEPQEKLFEDPNFKTLLRSSTQALAQDDWSLVVMMAGDDRERDRVLRYVRGGHVDGAILVSTHAGDPLIRQLPEAALPIVFCGRPPGRGVTLPYVASDDRGGARLMTRYLLNSGRERVGIITGPLDLSSGVDRLAGYRDVMRTRRLPQRVGTAADYSLIGGERCMDELLLRHPDLDAVFVGSDLLAAGALISLRRSGRRIPDDIAVGGFDDSSIAGSTDPPLTTVRQAAERVGAESAAMLAAVIAGRQVRPLILPTELVRRRSA